MILFFCGLNQELMGKIDIFQQICGFLLVIASKVLKFNFTLLLSNMYFTNLVLLRDEADYFNC